MVLVNGGGGRRGGGRGGEVGVTCSDDGYVRVWSLGRFVYILFCFVLFVLFCLLIFSQYYKS